MNHLPFLEALAAVADTSDPVWQDVAVGYLVLRFFDEWLEEGSALIGEDPGLVSLDACIRDESDLKPTVRDLLLATVQTIREAPQVNPALVSESLLAYGKYLQSTGQLLLAAHVYATMITVLDLREYVSDPGSTAAAYMHYAFVTRLLGQFPLSQNAYQRADVLSQATGDMALTLRARIGLSNTLRACGNLGDAETLLDRVITDATAAGLVNAQSGALHNRGGVRNLRGRPVEAMRDLSQAYMLTNDPAEREVILGDWAACAGSAGYWDMARDANRVLADTAHIPVVRSAALGNLLELAAINNDETEFTQVLDDIHLHMQQHPLPAEHAVHMQLYTAYGIERFGTREAAIEAYRMVMAEAHDAGLHQLAFKAAESLNTLIRKGSTSC